MKDVGRSEFQYVYRVGEGVYWHSQKNGFHYDPKGDVNLAKWFKHMIEMIQSEFGLVMRSSESLDWKNVPLDMQPEVLKKLNDK